MQNQNMPFQFSPATTQRASEVIYQQIYQKIVDKELHPGDHLPSERDLAELFHRSRPCVREALRMLQQDGLIEIIVGSTGGPIVRGVSMETVKEPLKKLIETHAINLNELLEYRHINDHGCARLAAEHRTDEDITAMNAILSEAKANIQNPLSFQEYDVAFHTALAKASKNSLAILINDVIVKLNTDVFIDVACHYSEKKLLEANARIYETHYAILQAVIAGDPIEADRCVDAMVDFFRKIVK